MSALGDALNTFRDRVNGDDRLKEMNRDWSRRIRVQPSDADEAWRISYEEGVMAVDQDLSGDFDILLRAPGEILTGVFSGASSPTEPYLDGSLTIQGSQEDVLRLDFLSLMIWGE